MEEIEAWRKAAGITGEALAYGKSLIKKGSTALEVVEKVEEKIRKLGGKPAFPAQLSMDHVAAHSCPGHDDKTILDSQLIKLDVGAHINGCIGDAACTVDLSGENAELVEASQKALEAAIRMAKPGTKVFEIGQAIQDIITSYGFSPVRNLSGHGLEKFDVHAEPSIPNFNNGDSAELEENQVIAIEPFATKGSGIVIETGNTQVFSLKEKKPVRDATTREILKEIGSYEGLPFAKRWLTKKFPAFKVNLAMHQIINNSMLMQHPPLAEKEKKAVSQAEHTILVKEKPEVLTKI